MATSWPTQGSPWVGIYGPIEGQGAFLTFNIPKSDVFFNSRNRTPQAIAFTNRLQPASAAAVYAKIPELFRIKLSYLILQNISSTFCKQLSESQIIFHIFLPTCDDTVFPHRFAPVECVVRSLQAFVDLHIAIVVYADAKSYGGG